VTALGAIVLLANPLSGQVLDVPPRPPGAPSGTQFTNIITTLSRVERENWIQAQILGGNVPGWLRLLHPVTTVAGARSATYHVTPDYLAVGSDDDYFLAPMTPILGQRLADQLGGSLPTERMVNQIWTNAAVKLSPQTIPPSGAMTTVPVFAQHNVMVRTNRNASTHAHPLGALVSGDKKDVIISNEITNRPPPPRVVIYGWHYPDGSFIQPLSAVHEETYADYSHGIRWVQAQLTVNGGSSTVAQVLASPTLAPLLSDEGVIPLPRYTVAPQAPVIMTHPRNRSVLPGQPVTLRAMTIGDAPLSYRWFFNGSTLSGATNAVFEWSQTQPAQAGSYLVVASNATGTATSRVAVVRVKSTDFPALFADDFDSDSSANWNVFWGAANGVPDYSVEFAFDYGATPHTFNGVTALIPPAPNSSDGSTRGLRLTVNQADGLAANAAVNVYPQGFAVAGDFALKFDLWMQYPGGALGVGSTGSTEFAQCGIHHLGTQVNWPGAVTSDGLWFGVSGEGGAAADYRAYVGQPAGSPLDLTGNLSASGLVATNHTAAFFQNLFPGGRFETPGAPGKQWVEVEVRQVGNTVTWLMDGTTVAQRVNTSAHTNGTIMLGLMDVFPSIANPARDSFVLFDNVRVESLSPPVEFQGIVRPTEDTVTLTLHGAFGDSVVLEVSPDLLSWNTVQGVQFTNAMVSVTDTTANVQTRFYRTRRGLPYRADAKFRPRGPGARAHPPHQDG
jgi:hypothetical protein